MHDLHFHDLRHTAATWLGEARVEYATIEKLLGHRLPGMGEQYIHDWKTKLRAAVTALEQTVMERFREAAQDERVREFKPCPMPAGCTVSNQRPPWWIESAEQQNRAAFTSLSPPLQLKGARQ